MSLEIGRNGACSAREAHTGLGREGASRVRVRVRIRVRVRPCQGRQVRPQGHDRDNPAEDIRGQL